MTEQEKLWTLKETDQTANTTKGAAYKAFTQLREGFDEGRDYYFLKAGQDDTEIETLRGKGRIYENSVNAILLTSTGFESLLDYLRN